MVGITTSEDKSKDAEKSSEARNSTLPSNFLLDEKGIIIGRNLMGIVLYNKVNEVLNAKK